MRTGWGGENDCRFDVPPRFGVIERRMSGLALDAWAMGGQRRVAGFDDNSLIITDPAGAAIIAAVGAPITATFGLAPGMMLAGHAGLGGECAAACDLIALRPLPVPFEASLAAPGSDCILVRGIALPLSDSDDVQIVVNWREVLNRAATTRLRREFGAALRISATKSARIDPFSSNSVA